MKIGAAMLWVGVTVCTLAGPTGRAMDLQLKVKTALVTGSTAGIGGCSLHAENTLPRWHHAHRAGAAGLHGAPGGTGATTADAPDPLPRRARPAQPVPGGGDAGAPRRGGAEAAKTRSLRACISTLTCALSAI